MKFERSIGLLFLGLMAFCIPALGQDQDFRSNQQESAHSEKERQVCDVLEGIHRSGKIEDEAAWWLRWCRSTEEKFGTMHPNVARIAGSFGYQLYEDGRYKESRQIFQAQVDALKASEGLEHPETLRALNNLAQLTELLGEIQVALEIEEEVVQGYTRLLGHDHPSTLLAKANLAGTLHDLPDLARARELQEEVVEGLTRIKGADHPDTLIARGNLAATRFSQGDLSEARKLEERVVEARIRVSGLEHRDTLLAQANLAVTLEALGDFAAARTIFENVLDVRERTLGAEHPETLTTEGLLAGSLRALGEFKEAKEREQNLVDSYTRLFGPEHPSTIAAISNLANTLSSLGDLESARQKQEAVLEVRTRRLGKDHPLTLTVKGNLAITFRLRGDLKTARRLYEEVLAVRDRKQGRDHPDTLRERANLAVTLRTLGDLAKARELYEETLASSTEVLGSEHTSTLTVMANYAVTLDAMGEKARALELQCRVFETRVQVLGPEHPETMTAKTNFATALFRDGAYEQAYKYQKEVLDVLVDLLGEKHPSTLIVKASLAGSLRAQGRLVEALKVWEEVLTARTEVLGPKHPDTQLSTHNLAFVLHLLGDSKKAITLLSHALRLRQQAEEDFRPSTELEVESLWLLARLYRERAKKDSGKSLPLALQAYEWALEAIENQAGIFDFDEEIQTGFLVEKETVFYEAGALALELGKPEKAFEILERYRGFSLIADQVRSGGLTAYLDSESSEMLLSKSQRYDQITDQLYSLKTKTGGNQFQDLVNEQISLRRERAVLLGRIARERREKNLVPTPIKITEIQQAFPGETALLAYSLGDEAAHLFVLTAEAIYAYRLKKDSSAIGDQVKYLNACLRAMSGFNPSVGAKTSKERNTEADDLSKCSRRSEWLLSVLLEPAEEILRRKKRWLILPDGALHSLAFASLEGLDGSSLAIGNRDLHVAQSATTYRELLSKRPDPKAKVEIRRTEWIGLGNPEYPQPLKSLAEPGSASEGHLVKLAALQEESTTLPSLISITRSLDRWGYSDFLRPLPNSQREIERILEMFAKRSRFARAHLGENATEDLVRRTDLRHVRYLHLAGHGITFPNKPREGKHPSDSLIALSTFSKDERTKRGLKHNGFLQAWEIAHHLRLNADLVVLSACETGLGEYRGGEGLMSLARAFLQAGARSVLASLWNVDDLSTSELMIRFYDHLLNGKSKAESLRLAQQELASGPIEVELDGKVELMDFTAPYYWSGFQLIGDWK